MLKILKKWYLIEESFISKEKKMKRFYFMFRFETFMRKKSFKETSAF